LRVPRPFRRSWSFVVMRINRLSRIVRSKVGGVVRETR
jgi:hypothetical protein